MKVVFTLLVLLFTFAMPADMAYAKKTYSKKSYSSKTVKSYKQSNTISNSQNTVKPEEQKPGKFDTAKKLTAGAVAGAVAYEVADEIGDALEGEEDSPFYGLINPDDVVPDDLKKQNEEESKEDDSDDHEPMSLLTFLMLTFFAFAALVFSRMTKGKD